MNESQTVERTGLRVTLRLETQASGAIVAAVVEFPECRVEAATREEAIERVQAALLERLAHVELIPWDVPLPPAPADVAQSVAVFRDNPIFVDIMSRIQAERDSYGDEEMEVSEYVR
jgi:predicted RNase H-like HicB family nuclease